MTLDPQCMGARGFPAVVSVLEADATGVTVEEIQVVTVVGTLAAVALVVGPADLVVREDLDTEAMAAMVAQVVSGAVLEARLVMGVAALTEAVEKVFGLRRTPTKEKERVRVRFGADLAVDRRVVARPVAPAAAVVLAGTVTGTDLPVEDRLVATG